jgi:hypothetical protein
MDIRWEVKTVREMRHPNLVPFVGACIDEPNVCILSELVLKVTTAHPNTHHYDNNFITLYRVAWMTS